MPEVKNSFTGGKMNKDLDERLVPKDQYRDALNIEVATSEGSDVGTVQNILGNKRIENLVGSGFTCVGSISNERTNKLYWFLSTYNKDMILEYDVENDITSPVLVDKKAGTQKAVLKFFGNIITGINIIDDLLFWSDNKGEPKKININRCKEGTINIDTHTQLSFSNNSFTGLAVEYVTTSEYPNDSSNSHNGFHKDFHPPLKNLEDSLKIGRYFTFERRKFVKMLGYEFDQLIDDYGCIMDGNSNVVDTTSSHYAPGNLNPAHADGYVFKARHYRKGELIGAPNLKVWDNRYGIHVRYDSNHTDSDFEVGDVVFAVDIKLDIEEKHITVLKPKPLKAPSIKINYKESDETTTKIPNLFEEKFPRFSYRYKYADGEFSPFAPFTEPVFNPQYTKDTSKSVNASVLYDKDTVYDEKDPRNKAMVNSIHSIDLMDFITINTPEDVVEIDLLYKQEDSPNIYSIGTVKHTDFEWHASIFNTENKEQIFGGVQRYGGATNSSNFTKADHGHLPAAQGGYNSGKYIVTTENIYAALPANQLLRPWDNVPRKALAQDVTGNRIVYGNYLQNYTIGSKPQVFVDYSSRKQTLNSFDIKALPSIKSQRNYQVGVIYCDEFGRETPVFTSNSGAVHIPWAEKDGSKNASKSNQLITSVNTNFPSWVDSIKFFVKENSGEYYNLVMERAWTGKSTYEFDNSEGHLWISFPSSDRNKISEEDYIILKKKIGAGEEQVTFENKFKVVDIQDEAPDALKYELINLGTVSNDVNDSLTVNQAGTAPYDKLFFNPDYRPDKMQNTIILDISRWMGTNGTDPTNGYRGDLMPTGVGEDVVEIDDLYLSWSRVDSDGLTAASSKYRVNSGWKGTDGYVFKLNRDIKEIDADIAARNGNAARDTSETHVHRDLVFQVEKKVLKEGQDFSGQFFVKISKNQITSIIEHGHELTNLDKFQVTSKHGVWYWHDDKNGNTQNNTTNPHHFSNNGNPYGITNFFGNPVNHDYGVYPYTTSNNVQAGPWQTNNNLNGNGGVLRICDWYSPWEDILAALVGKPRFFIDGMHMASGQSQESDYAKYNCITWSGVKAGAKPTNWAGIGAQKRGSAWSYPPVKKWFTETTKSDIKMSEDGLYYTGGAYGGAGRNHVGTSHLFDQNIDWILHNDTTDEPEGIPIDGWVGSSQHVRRATLENQSTTNSENTAANHINGLEGIVTTNEYHTTGPRRWLSGMNGDDYGVGKDTRTYSTTGDEEGKHFMHLSFFAPGRDLHDNSWHFSSPALYGEDSFMDNLQGIWGGGVFTGKALDDKFGGDSDYANKHYHLAMEGNYGAGEEETYVAFDTPPSPGIGYGYDIDYRELHERQWDPTFNSEGDTDNKIRDFIRNLYPGSRFRFHHTKPGAALTAAELDDAVYTIKKVQIKKLYNHTNWRSHYNVYYNTNGGYNYTDMSLQGGAYRSVEDCALLWLDTLTVDGVYGAGLTDNAAVDFTTNRFETLKKKIVDFGAAHNRRICYILELDKNPCTWGPANNTAMGDPLNTNTNGQDAMCGDLDHDNYNDIEFLDPIQDIVLGDLNKFPAIWESSPKKKDIDLDIYYEASNNIPVKINRHTNELFAPKGCLIEMINPPFNQSSDEVYLVEWNDNIATFEPGFDKGDVSGGEINYSDIKFKFIRQDGSYTVAETGLQQLTGQTTGYKDKFIFKTNIGDRIQTGLNWYNCFSFGNGLESNRINDGFNEMFITNGVKASTTTQETYQEEHRKHGIIHSGLYNSNSGVNDLNQFIMAEKITKDLNPTYGSIQKLFSRDSDLVAFCEDKVIKILANKDALFNADGNTNLTATQNVLGQSVPFVGEYGISKNPESFASESYRAYFTDKTRGAVLRLSKDGLTPISKAGMHDWFRDNLSKYTSLIGTYDSYKEDYNITLSNTYTENIIFNTFFQLGQELRKVDASVLSVVTSGAPVTGSEYEHSWETKDIGSNSEYNAHIDDVFTSSITVENHPFIPAGYFQLEQTGTGSPPSANVAISYQQLDGYVPPGPDTPWEDAKFTKAWGSINVTFPYSTIPVPHSGKLITTNFGALNAGQLTFSPNDNIFGPNTGEYSNDGDPGETLGDTIRATVNRYVYDGTSAVKVTENSFAAQKSSNSYFNYKWGVASNGGHLTSWYPGTARKTAHPAESGASGSGFTASTASATASMVRDYVSGTIFQRQSGGGIVFDRCHYNSYVLFKDIGKYSAGAGSLTNSIQTSMGQTLDALDTEHSAMYAGDELHVQVKLKVYLNVANNSGNRYQRYGYVGVRPYIALRDGGSSVPSSSFVSNPPSQSSHSTDYRPYEYYQTTPSNSPDMNDWTGYIYSRSNGAQNPLSTNEGGYLLNSTGQCVMPGNYGGSPGTYRTISGYRPNGDISNIQKYIGQAAQTFPRSWYMYSNAHTPACLTAGNFNYGYEFETHNPAAISNSHLSYEMVVGASYKFRDSAQQDSSGAFTGSGNNGIIPTKVIDDLQILVKNAASGTSTTVGPHITTGEGSHDPMSRPLWEILDIKVRKGFAIQEDAQYFVAGDPGNPGQWNTYYDDPLTGGQDGLTTSDITNAGGAWDPTQNNGAGGWVLNQAAIDAWVSSPLGGAYYQPPLPPTDVHAFVYVNHSNHNWERGYGNSVSNITTSPGGQWFKHFTTPYFGLDRDKVTHTENLTDPATGTASGAQVIWYSKGADPGGQSPQEGNHGNTPQTQQLGYNQPFDKLVFDYEGTQYPAPPAATLTSTGVTPGAITHDDFVTDYWRILTNSNYNGGYGIKHIPDSDLQLGEWYMVDVEFNEVEHPESLTYNGGTPPVVGSNASPGDGLLAVRGVVSTSIPILTDLAEYGGYGTCVGGGSDYHCGLRPYWRTEYSDERWVLRGVFKIEADSYVVASGPPNLDALNIRYYNVYNAPMYTNKIICRKVSYINNTGAASDWLKGTIGAGDKHLQINTLTNRNMYYHSGSLCYDNLLTEDNYLAGTSGTGESWWQQNLAGQVLDVGSGWILKFTVGTNPKTNNFNGPLGVKITGPLGADIDGVAQPANEFTGIRIWDIQDQGNYEVNFTMNKITTDWTIEKGGIDYSGTASMDEYGASGWSNTWAGSADKIGFYNASGNTTTPISCGISEVFLTQTETIFSGGQAGSWNFNGFDSTSEQFITWDTYWSPTWDPMLNSGVGGYDSGNSSVDGRIQFTNCPMFDPSFGNGNVVISANQYIDKVVNRYEKYEISFNFRLVDQDPDTGVTIPGTGLLHMYYFNGEGHGFRINDIGDGGDNGIGIEGDVPPNPNYTKDPIYDDQGNFLWWRVTKIVGIGDGSTPDDNAYTEFAVQGVEALRDTLVIRKDGSSGSTNLTGWIDDISMRRVYNIEMNAGSDGILGNEDDVAVYSEKTITFSEDVNGWTSFKSFIPESGLSLSKKYFTIKNGYLYQHYKPLKFDETITEWIDCAYNEAENYNHFYDHLADFANNYSKVTAVLNVEPSTIKTFNTLNYEGSQAFVTNPGDVSKVTVDNALAWSLTDHNVSPIQYPNLEGWKCVDITTNFGNANLLEFIKKEGKWFGHIRGKTTGAAVGNLDTTRLSVQGIGNASQIDIITQ